jgi:peptidoglycan L-alanyl-D-glutamate endopeptidase CwlK
MPMFSQTSFSRLATCHMELQTLFYEVIRTFDCTILEGHRNEADQEKAVADGKSKLHWPHGKHNANPSMAVDVAPYPVNFTDTKRLYYFGGWVQGVAQRLKDEGKMTYSIRWGGDWNGNKDLDDQTFFDLVHFELI